MSRLLFILLLVGCSPDPMVHCDYCHAMRSEVRRYFCMKCSQAHASCPVDCHLLRWDKDGKWATNPRLEVCPPPEEPKAMEVPIIAPPVQASSSGNEFTPWQRAVLLGILVPITLLLGFFVGRDTMKRKLTVKFNLPPKD